MKMTEQERDNTLWNVIEVETAHNVPQSAKLVLPAVKYTDLPLKVAEYRASLSGTDPHYGKGEAEDFATHLRDRWNQDFEWEQGKDDLDGYWMGSSAFDHWHTSIPRKPPTCDLQVSHYLFFQRVESQEIPSHKHKPRQILQWIRPGYPSTYPDWVRNLAKRGILETWGNVDAQMTVHTTYKGFHALPVGNVLIYITDGEGEYVGTQRSMIGPQQMEYYEHVGLAPIDKIAIQ